MNDDNTLPFRDELIGRKVKVMQKDTQAVYEGEIVDETKSTIKLRCADQTKTFIKNNITITFNQGTIDGKQINRRPQERIKI